MLGFVIIVQSAAEYFQIPSLDQVLAYLEYLSNMDFKKEKSKSIDHYFHSNFEAFFFTFFLNLNVLVSFSSTVVSLIKCQFVLEELLLKYTFSARWYLNTRCTAVANLLCKHAMCCLCDVHNIL